jgi:hypothetical protein
MLGTVRLKAATGVTPTILVRERGTTESGGDRMRRFPGPGGKEKPGPPAGAGPVFAYCANCSELLEN